MQTQTRHPRPILAIAAALLALGLGAAAAQVTRPDLAQACLASAEPAVAPPGDRAACRMFAGSGATAVIETRQTATDPVLAVTFQLPAWRTQGNWLSIRNDFAAPRDLAGATALRLTLRSTAPSDARLRLTLSDTGAGRGDDLWWADLDPGLLAADRGWISVEIPVAAFRPCHGLGCRTNDRRLDLGSLAGWEINLLADPGPPRSGTLLVGAVTPL